MKHILLNFNHYRTPKDMGGLRSWHIGTHLSKKGYCVTAIIPGIDALTGKKKENLAGKLWSEERLDGVKVIWANSFKNDRRSKIKRAMYYLSTSIVQFFAMSTVTKIDAIICMSLPSTSMLFSYIHSALRKIPFIIDVRDLPTDTAIELNYLKKNFLFNLVLRIEQWLFKQSDCLIAVSDGWRTRLNEKGVSPEKIHVVPLGFDGKEIYNQYIERGRHILDELGLNKKFVVAYTGTLGHVFDIQTVLKAAQKTSHLKGIVYLFAGGGQQLDGYKKFAKENNLNCIFLGPRPKADIMLICAQADICICPYQKGRYVASILGNKIFDYMGNGKATIYSGPAGDVSVLLNKSGGGICLPAYDSDGIAKAILALKSEPEKLKILGKNAETYITENYTVEKMMKKFEYIISKFL